MSKTPQTFYVARAKRALDIAGSSILLLITAPIQALCAIAIAANDGRPVYYHQSRVGKDGKIFRIHKFRTMTVGTDLVAAGYPSPEMVTKVGRTLRRLSLDEIPQLANILRGEMSLIGPRPALPSQVERYTSEQRGRLVVRPGLTGLAQIRHRDSAPWSRRIETDLEYVRGLSLGMDLRILFRSIPAVLRAQGQLDEDTATDPDDLGTDEAKAGRAHD